MEVSRIEPDSESKAEFRNTEGDYFSFKKKLTEWAQRLGLESAADFTLPGTPGIGCPSPAPGKQFSRAVRVEFRPAMGRSVSQDPLCFKLLATSGSSVRTLSV
jgi:hypothetical protein